MLPLWLFCAFLTQVKLLPNIPNNLGPFEVLGVLCILMFLLESAGKTPTVHPLAKIVLLWIALAALSQVQIQNRLFGLVQLALLVFLFAFFVLFNNLFRRHQISLDWFLARAVLAVLIVGLLVVADRVESGGAIEAAGPFRGRAHLATYMLSSFWIALVAVLWPTLGRLPRLVAGAGLLTALYAIAVSGRRSVYLSLFVGLAGLGFALIAAKRGRRGQWLAAALAAVLFLAGLYKLGSEGYAGASFFRERVGLIDDRLASFLGTGNESGTNFYALQRIGVRRALRASPVVGIGWGGFAGSEYSPTGHEVHSTPLRFLAELGIVGFVLYVVFIISLLGRSARLFVRMRSSPYSNAYLALAVATWSMTVSYVYNRHLTERTFWIFLVLFVAMETFSRDWFKLRQLSREEERSKRVGAHEAALEPAR